MTRRMLWGGRFEKMPLADIIEFNSAENIKLDNALVPYDIIGSLAHVKMLHEQRIISAAEYKSIVKALLGIHTRWEKGLFRLRKELEDVHMNIETAVTAITANGKKMHTARSRNDQILLDMRMYMRDGVLAIIDAIEDLQGAFAELSKKDGPMVSYTHTRVAQPITISFWCDSWVHSFQRDIDRLCEAYRRINQNPLGACAIAGTSWRIDREKTAKLLAFDTIQENELDTITSRGECEAELLSVLSIVMCKLSRLSEEIIWLSEKGVVTIAEEHTTGSSIMPNKKNPDVLELIRGRSGRAYGNLVHCLVVLKGLISGYHSDMQETKYAIMSGIETAYTSINAMRLVLGGLGFNQKNIEEELDRGFAQATEIADYLAMNGLPFREAHEKTGKLVRYCEKKGKRISALEATEAGEVLGIDIQNETWCRLKGFGRERLKREVRLKPSTFVRKEKEKIEKAYLALLSAH